MATPRRDVDKGVEDTRKPDTTDEQANLLEAHPMVTYTPTPLIDDNPSPVNMPASQSPVDIIKQHVDGIQQAALTLPSSDDLAKVLFLTQQLLEVVNEFMRLFAERQAVVAELNVDDNAV